MPSNVNALNKDGLSAVEYAVKMAAERFLRMGNIFFEDGCRFGEGHNHIHMDCSIGDFQGEYQYYIKELLKNDYIRVHGMFGLTVSSNRKYLIHTHLDFRNSDLHFDITPGMKALHKLTKSGFQGKKNDSIVKSLLQILLSNDSGNLKDAVKAQGLVVAIEVRKGWLSWEGCWLFNPSDKTKEAGCALRELFVKHSASALYSVERYIRVLHREYKSFNLSDVRDALKSKFGITPYLWGTVLAFAGLRNHNDERINKLRSICTVIDKEICPFFFGGIQLCIDRKAEQKIPADVWDLVFEFAGLSASIKTQDAEESMGPLYTREQMMARYRTNQSDGDAVGEESSSRSSDSSSDEEDTGNENEGEVSGSDGNDIDGNSSGSSKRQRST
jgi:hypothetical protein